MSDTPRRGFVEINLGTILTSACLAAIIYVGATLKDLTISVAKMQTKDGEDDKTLVEIRRDLEVVKAQYAKLNVKLALLAAGKAIDLDDDEQQLPIKPSRTH